MPRRRSPAAQAYRLQLGMLSAMREAQEMAIASQTVIARRMLMGAEAMTQPSAKAALEGSRMVTEKMAAAAQAGGAVAAGAARIVQAGAAAAVREGQHLATARTPAASAMAIQRMGVANLNLWSEILKTTSAAMSPYSRRVKANAGRLG